MRGVNVGTAGRVTVCLIVIATLFAAAGVRQGAWGAQPTGEPGGEPAADRELLFQATLERTSSDPLALQLLRITLEPGGRSPLHAHPGLEFGVVESGRLTVQVTGRAVMLPAGSGAEEESQPLPTGVEVTLETGDRIAYAPGTGMTFRNPGPGTTTLLAATVLAAGPDAPPGAVYPGGTPSADQMRAVRSQLLGEAVIETPHLGRSAITLERFSLRSGAGVPGYAGPVLIAVEEGGLSGAVLAGEAAVPVATPGADGAAGFRLTAGQALFLPRGMRETPPLAGEGTVVFLRLGMVTLPEEAGAPVATPPTTQEPTAAAGVEGLEVGTRVVVTVPEARLRAAPSLEAEVLAGLAQGQALIVAGPAEADETGQVWYPVAVEADPALAGYVAAGLIAPEEG